MKTEEGNRLIAEFMGAKFNKDYPAILYPQEHVEVRYIRDLLYHSSWDWLMPAVKKWNDLVISKRTECDAGWTKWQYKTVMLRTEIDPVFTDLVEGIQWYNKQTRNAAGRVTN